MTEQPPGPPERPRWQDRFDSFRRALALLREAVGLMDERDLSPLEREGVVQRFEYCWELAWKTLADYLEYLGVVVVPGKSPRHVLRTAIENGYLGNGDAWMNALDARNLMSHTYSAWQFEKVVRDIHATYLGLFEDFNDLLVAEMLRLS